MPIYEYYCPDNHTIYQFYAKTLAQGQTIPQCPHNPQFRMVKMLSQFAVTSVGKKDDAAASAENSTPSDPGEDARMEAAMGAMEREFANVDENDPRAMARMMRRMSELTGEKIDGEMEEVVRKLEEGTDPEALEEELGGESPCSMPDPDDPYGGMGGEGAPPNDPKEPKHRFRVRRRAPVRDPQLYDYE
ncbi:MAG TPA: FmdB family transcriptional regulator [Opitutus sp.]|nr:FmdB family transcriptional regulator [Opitutus sp.]